MPIVKKVADALQSTDNRNVEKTSTPQPKYNNKKFLKCQTPEEEVEHRFTPKKRSSLLLSQSYRRLYWDKKADRVNDCGNFLEFHTEILGSGELGRHRLAHAQFCKDRLCPMCSWRRSLKIFGQVSKIMDVIQGEYRFLFLTLTIRNVAASDLDKAIDHLNSSWSRFIRYKDLAFIKGFYRALEVTRNNDKTSKSYGTYHPHFHCILAVSPSYFKKGYLRRDSWLRLWQRAAKDPSITQLDIRTVKPKDRSGQSLDEHLTSMAAAIAEVAKYPLKSSDLLFDRDPDLTDNIVFSMTTALHHRRLVAYGGCFKETYMQLHFDDPEDGDLLHLDDDLRPDLQYMITKYNWGSGCYTLCEKGVTE